MKLLALGATLVAVTLAVGCDRDSSPPRVAAAESRSLPTGCYSFTPLPDSVYDMATDIDWPTRLMLAHHSDAPDPGYEFTARVLDSTWNSLASPIGSARPVGADSMLLQWGGTGFRLEIVGADQLEGVATVDLYPTLIVGRVSGQAVVCAE